MEYHTITEVHKPTDKDDWTVHLSSTNKTIIIQYSRKKKKKKKKKNATKVTVHLGETEIECQRQLSGQDDFPNPHDFDIEAEHRSSMSSLLCDADIKKLQRLEFEHNGAPLLNPKSSTPVSHFSTYK